jgi:hypothetical protein
MATKLSSPLKRELAIDGNPYMLTIDADGLKLVPKGKRKGRELLWRHLASGEAALAVALNASLQRMSGVTQHPARARNVTPVRQSRPTRRRR